MHISVPWMDITNSGVALDYIMKNFQGALVLATVSGSGAIEVLLAGLGVASVLVSGRGSITRDKYCIVRHQ